MDNQKLREAFLQGDEQEAAKNFREMLRGALRMGLCELAA